VSQAESFAVRAELPGTVAEVIVHAGTAVEAGEPLVLLDSMKMEIPVLAPRPGTVRRVVVAPGDRLQQGDLVAVLDVRS
jgi:biotin carboxyl carrier protein